MLARHANVHRQTGAPLPALEQLKALPAGTDPDLKLAANRREGGYPYQHPMSRRNHEKNRYLPQVERLKLQAWVQDNGRTTAGAGLWLECGLFPRSVATSPQRPGSEIDTATALTCTMVFVGELDSSLPRHAAAQVPQPPGA